MDLILSTKSLGIEHFLKQEYHLAIEQYSKAIDLALKLYKNSKDVKKQIVLLYSNRSICHYKLDLFPEAVKDADKAIKIDARFAKGYVRRAVALESMNNLKEALQDYQKALKIEPNANAYKIGRGNIVMKMVSMQWQMLQEKQPDDYVIASGKQHSIRATGYSIIQFNCEIQTRTSNSR